MRARSGSRGLRRRRGVGRLVHVSAICDPGSGSEYAKSKRAGEEAVRAAFPDAAIMRPSVIFGAEDQFFNRFAAMARFAPVLPLVGADTRFQPVYVDDVAAAVEAAAVGRASPGATYELGGPEIATFRELMEIMLRVIRRRRLLVDVPFWLARLMARGLGAVEAVSFGLVPNRTITIDQIRQLGVDNVVADTALGLADLGVTPTAMEGVLEEYLYAYRPYGQYSAITESARGLRDAG